MLQVEDGALYASHWRGDATRPDDVGAFFHCASAYICVHVFNTTGTVSLSLRFYLFTNIEANVTVSSVIRVLSPTMIHNPCTVKPDHAKSENTYISPLAYIRLTDRDASSSEYVWWRRRALVPLAFPHTNVRLSASPCFSGARNLPVTDTAHISMQSMAGHVSCR